MQFRSYALQTRLTASGSSQRTSQLLDHLVAGTHARLGEVEGPWVEPIHHSESAAITATRTDDELRHMGHPQAAAVDAQDQLGAVTGTLPDGIHVAPFEQGEIGPELFRHTCLMGLEGLVSKHLDSLDRAVRSLGQGQEPAASGV